MYFKYFTFGLIEGQEYPKISVEKITSKLQDNEMPGLSVDSIIQLALEISKDEPDATPFEVLEFLWERDENITIATYESEGKITYRKTF